MGYIIVMFPSKKQVTKSKTIGYTSLPIGADLMTLCSGIREIFNDTPKGRSQLEGMSVARL